MITKHSLVCVILMGIFITLATIGVAYASKPQLDESSYTVEHRSNGYLRVRVQVNLADRGVRERYAAQQRAEALTLARSGTGSVSIQVTFARLLSIEELRRLAQQTSMVADLVIFEARDPSNELHTVAARGTGPDVVDLNSLAPGLNSRALHLVGATAVYGRVPASASGLGRLATDARVYIPDVTPHRLATELAERYGISVDKVQVSVPTSHWYLSTGR